MYTAAGKLGQQLVLAAVDVVLGNDMSAIRMNDGPGQAGLPDCTEAFRLLNEQVSCLANVGKYAEFAELFHSMMAVARNACSVIQSSISCLQSFVVLTGGLGR